MNYTGVIMSTQMKVAEQPEGWVVLNGDRPVAINGETHRARREDLVTDIESRGLFVWDDGEISKEAQPVAPEPTVPVIDEDPEPPVVTDDPEPPVVSENVDGGAPSTEDPPTDPGANPEDPDPNPTAPAQPSEDKPKKARAPRKPKLAADTDKLVAASKEVAPKPKRGRPAKPKDAAAERFTPEQKAARAEYAKKYRQTMSEEQKEKARERARERQKKWRESHPDKAAAFAKRSSERRKERYNTDPEFKQEYREKQRQYAKSSRGD